MSLMCAYGNCLCVKYPCSSIAFFKLPTDDRRSIWIKNSGNKTLINLSAKSSRFFCENHFRECDIRRQFNRKLLRKHAVPIEHESCKVPLQRRPEEAESIGIQDRRLGKSRSDCDVQKDYRDMHFDIEKLDDDSTITNLYEDMEPSSVENQSDDNIAEGDQENGYNLIDFYTTVQEDTQDPVESDKEHAHRKNNKLVDLDEIFFEETNSNQVDSSILVSHSEADTIKSSEELHMASQIPVKKRKFNEEALIEQPPEKDEPVLQITTPNQEYEEDKHFALSLVGYFQRLHKRQKALAKLKILQYLTELELGLSSNL